MSSGLQKSERDSSEDKENMDSSVASDPEASHGNIETINYKVSLSIHFDPGSSQVFGTRGRKGKIWRAKMVE